MAGHGGQPSPAVISTAFGHDLLLDDASVQVDAGERIAIVGRNGTGKSTLLRIIAGELDAGQRAK